MFAPCIYCFSDQPPRVKREHVIPRMLGAFENNWTVEFVCDECNGLFGRELEFALGRDSVEAIHRLQLGVKKASEYAELRYDRLTMVLEEDGPFQGAIVTLGPDAGVGVQPIPVPQAGFRRPGIGRFQWFLEAALDESVRDTYSGRGWEIRVAGPTAEDRQRVIARLNTIGIAFRPQPEVEAEIVNAENRAMVLTEATLDIPIQRALAKIAMNFAAHVLGPELLRRAEFDSARRFVRYGERPGYQVVQPSNDPILYGDTQTMRQTRGHVIIIEWRGSDVLVVRFSPFNFITYDIVLCQRFAGVWRHVSVGFVFDHEHHEVIPLTSTRLVRPPHS